MTTDEHPEDHPEAWLDLALSGRLTPSERTLLDRHVAICTACAAHLRIGESFRSDRSPEVHDDQLDRWAVERAMARVSHRASRQRWGVSPRLAWGFAGTLLLLATAVSAKLWRAKEISTARIRDDRPVSAVAPQHRTQLARVVAVDPAPEEVIAETAHREAEETTKTPTPRRSTQVTAAALFERARELGREGRVDAALSIHLRLQRLYPGTAEAGLSSALAGRLLLDRGHPAEALAQFDRHLAHGGAADEEALAGRAASLERLGRRAEEGIAWRTLLERHPESVYADRARIRLRDLSSR